MYYAVFVCPKRIRGNQCNNRVKRVGQNLTRNNAACYIVCRYRIDVIRAEYAVRDEYAIEISAAASTTSAGNSQHTLRAFAYGNPSTGKNVAFEHVCLQ